MISGIPVRHRLRSLAEDCGWKAAFGGPLPEGRRIELQLREGRVVGERDVSARWRGRLLIAEEPASLDRPLRDGLREAAEALAANAQLLGDIRLGVVLAGEDVSLVEVSADPGDLLPGGLRLSVTVSAGEPASRQARVVGRITGLQLPAGAWHGVDLGDVVEAAPGDPLVRFQVHGTNRGTAIHALRAALATLRIDGVPSDLHLLRQVAASDALAQGLHSSRDLDALAYAPLAIEVLAPGTHTTVQDCPGRLGYWDVGVPPSGPMDDLAFRLANRLVGNKPDAAALEMTLAGPTLRFHGPAVICLAGAPYGATLDDVPLGQWKAVAVPAGAVLRCGGPTTTGCRATLAIRHGLDVPSYLGSRSTFDLGGFGGHAGRPLAVGDWLPLTRAARADEVADCPALPASARPAYARSWEIGVLEGPHAAPDFFTNEDMDVLYANEWKVHHNSNRTGVRLIGPKPRWARRDGGEAGLHPSNIHDNAYAVGAIDFTGDMPILLGPDGPSCGGFVCPAVTVAAERWKLGQLRPGDTVRFRRLTPQEVVQRSARQERLISELRNDPPSLPAMAPDAGKAVIAKRFAGGGRPALCMRRSGDRYLLVEYGETVLDIGLRLRVHLLQEAVARSRLAGVIDLTPGVRSLQIHVDPALMPIHRLVSAITDLDDGLPSSDEVEVPTRIVHLPLSWDDPSTRKAIDIYMRTVRPDAPWCPSNLEFIRRINGLDSIDQVREIVFSASYLVLGLGDVYLGAPVATPLDPRHRLVTTKYNPARTWTPQNAVGIGGAYMCVYGMEGPGGYQFVGRTVPVWNTWKTTANFAARTPWLLRCFDQIRFHPVSAAELLDLRQGVTDGTTPLRIEASTFNFGAYRRFLAEQAPSIASFRTTQRAAFAAERDRWAKEGL